MVKNVKKHTKTKIKEKINKQNRGLPKHLKPMNEFCEDSNLRGFQ